MSNQIKTDMWRHGMGDEPYAGVIHNKRPAHWRQLDSTQAFIDAIRENPKYTSRGL